MNNPYEREFPLIVATCYHDNSDIYEGEDIYWLEVKGYSHLLFCNRVEAQEFALSNSINPDYVSWREATEFYEPEDESYFVTKEESWG
jgi:hypothetical protein